MARYLNAAFASTGMRLFTALVLFQGFHELEHITQVIQRYMLGIPNGNGLIGSLADVEPVHFVYNTGYLLLLVATYTALRLDRGTATVGKAVFILMTFALVAQSWHEVEHIFKLAQYIRLGVNGTGGIFGVGPGGLIPLAPIPLLHMAYNTVAYVPAAAAFAALVRHAPFGTGAEHGGTTALLPTWRSRRGGRLGRSLSATRGVAQIGASFEEQGN